MTRPAAASSRPRILATDAPYGEHERAPTIATAARSSSLLVLSSPHEDAHRRIEDRCEAARERRPGAGQPADALLPAAPPGSADGRTREQTGRSAPSAARRRGVSPSPRRTPLLRAHSLVELSRHPVGERFRYVFGQHGLRARERRDRPAHSRDAGAAASRERQPLHGARAATPPPPPFDAGRDEQFSSSRARAQRRLRRVRPAAPPTRARGDEAP